MRLGLLGGTFDPPHVGHLLAASDVADQLELDQVVLIPAAQQPLKVGSTHAPAEDRLAMVRLSVEGDARFGVDAVEVERGGLSYSAETLEGFRVRYPEAERYFLVGQDALESLPRWRHPERVVSLARLVVMRRAADPARSDGGDPAGFERALAAVRSISAAPEPLVVATRRVDVSSTEIRGRVRAGQSIRGFVTEAVERYIGAHGLYR